jgi:hypothetical protein
MATGDALPFQDPARIGFPPGGEASPPASIVLLKMVHVPPPPSSASAHITSFASYSGPFVMTLLKNQLVCPE